jgi:hypothetical protein
MLKARESSFLFALLTSNGTECSAEGLEQALNRFVVIAAQDSAASLSALVSTLCEDSRDLQSRVRAWRLETAADVANEDDFFRCSVWRRFSDPLALGELLKTLVARVSYGYRSPSEAKLCSVFEDTSTTALWRWEVGAVVSAVCVCLSVC